MHQTARRLPRAGIDAITTGASAFALVALATHVPLRPETIVILLDEARCGRAIVVVADTDEPDDVLEVVECLTTGLHAEELAGLVVASVRPDGAGLDAGDVDRWLEMSHIAADIGAEVLEWWVIGDEVRSPRDALGEAPRW